MRGRLLLPVVAALVAVAPAGAVSRTCPGPGCAPVGSFSVSIPASGKATFYVVTFKGTATKQPAIALSLTGSPPTGHVAILLGVSNVKRAVAAGGSTSFEGFAPSGTFTPAGNPTVTPTACATFKEDYHALAQLGDSPVTPTSNMAKHILANQIEASCGK